MGKFVIYSTLILLFLSENVSANPKIYLIRHATVQIEKPGWGSSKKAYEYKQEYNINSVEVFDPASVLKKIDNRNFIFVIMLTC